MLAFIDLEASSLLSSLSFPTEVGWVSADFSAGYVALIEPEFGWADWDPEAEAVTDLSRKAIIRLGEPVGQVATALNDMLAGAEVLTDNPAADGRWLRKLFYTADIAPTFPVYNAMQSDPGSPPSTEVDADILVVQAAEHLRAEYAFVQDHELIAQRIAAGADLRAHRALDDALHHAVDLAAAQLIHLSDDELIGPVQKLVEKVKTIKAAIINDAVARHVRNGGRDGNALRMVLER
jgi:hypothetical protein